MKPPPSLVLWLALSLALAACSNSRMAGQRAGEGAATGAATGAVWGAISGVFRGDVLERTVEGAAIGAGVGATAGAMRGSSEDAELKRTLGPDGYRAAMALVDCRHDQAYADAAIGQASDDAEYSLIAHWIEAVIAEDEDNRERTDEVAARLVDLDDTMRNTEDVRVEIRLLERELHDLRRRLGRRATCP